MTGFSGRKPNGRGSAERCGAPLGDIPHTRTDFHLAVTIRCSLRLGIYENICWYLNVSTCSQRWSDEF